MTRFLMISLLTLMAAPALAQDGAVSPGKARLDTDKDGYVSRTEFMAAQEKRFGETDANADGKISDDEHKASYERWRDRRKAEAGPSRSELREAQDDAAEDSKAMRE